MTLTVPPHDDDLEVTLIGPNVGECVVIHHRKSWLIVDSCKDKASGLPAALKYLGDLAVTPDQVKIIACSHWHDDHFKGLAQLYATYPSAQLWMSGALKASEFVELIEAYRSWPAGEGPHSSGLREMTACIDLARKSGKAPNFATHDQRMWLATDGSAELWSLSPSSEMIRLGFADIAKLMPTAWSVTKTATVQSPNHIAVAMHFRAGFHSVLLGSDLEEHGDPLTGWSAILNSTTRPPQLASLFKVGHHGSKNAEHAGIWQRLLTEKPLAVLTPFSRSRLPRDTDVARLKAKSSKVFLSAARSEPDIKRQGALGKMLRSKKIKAVDGQSGVIQCRVRASDAVAEWQVVLSGMAKEL